MRITYDVRYTTLGIALAGVHGTSPNPHGDTACSTTFYDSRLNCYLGELVEGGTVIDKRPCSESDIIMMAVAGPMLKESLPNGMMSRPFSGPPIKCENPKECQAMDMIALDVYCRLWESMGAKIGKRKGNQIIYTDGSVFPIPAAKNRWKEER